MHLKAETEYLNKVQAVHLSKMEDCFLLFSTGFNNSLFFRTTW